MQWDGSNKRINKILYIDCNTGQEQQISARAVVLAAGSLASTKILLNSANKDFPDGLGNENGLLGKYLHDNPLECVTVKLNTKFSLFKRGLYMTRLPYNESPPLRAVGYQIYGGTGLLANARSSIRFLSKSEESGSTVSFYCFGTTVPTPENFVSLSKTFKDKQGLPILELNVNFNTEDKKNMTLGKARIERLLSATDSQFSLMDSDVEPPGVAVHYGGTVRMHRSPTYGVLDSWNKVFSVNNLIVVDASCFTTSVEKNPTLTAMALSMRATEKLIHDSGR